MTVLKKTLNRKNFNIVIFENEIIMIKSKTKHNQKGGISNVVAS